MEAVTTVAVDSFADGDAAVVAALVEIGDTAAPLGLVAASIGVFVVPAVLLAPLSLVFALEVTVELAVAVVAIVVAPASAALAFAFDVYLAAAFLVSAVPA